MKRLPPALLTIGLLAAACGGDTPVAQNDGIAALEDAATATPEAGATESDTKKGAGKSGSKKGSKSSKGSGDDSGGDAATSNPGGSGSGSGGGGDSAGSQASSGARPASAVPQGRYDYATEGRRTVSGSSQDMPENTTLSAEAPNDGIQKQLRDLRDKDGNGTLTETHLLYRSKGVYLTYIKVTSKFQGGLTDVREFNLPQPELIAPTGGDPGFKHSFTMEGSGTRADVTIAAQRWETVKVGGSSIKALRVRTNIEFSGSLEGEQSSLAWFWPKHVLTLKEQVRTDVSSGPVRLQSNYRATLKQT